MMTKQEAFDTVAKHLFAQGRKSVSDGGMSCKYRSHDGLKCAIGALIPDDEYKMGFEGSAASSVLSRVPSISHLDGGLLDDLQDSHDYDCFWISDETMRERLGSVAEDYDLSPAILDTLSFNRPTA